MPLLGGSKTVKGGAGNSAAIVPGGGINTLGQVADGVFTANAAGRSKFQDGIWTDTQVATANKDGADATAGMRTLGYSAGKAMPGVARLDQVAAPTADVSMNNQKVTNLAAGTAASDACRVDQIGDIFSAADLLTAAQWKSTFPVIWSAEATSIEGGGIFIRDNNASTTSSLVINSYLQMVLGSATPALGTTAWAAGDKIEVLVVLSFNGFASLAANMMLAFELSTLNGNGMQTTSTHRRIAVGVTSTGSIRVITADGTTATNTDTGLTAVSGTVYKVKIVFTKGTNVVVTVDANAPTTVTATLPSYLTNIRCGRGTSGSAASIYTQVYGQTLCRLTRG